MAVVSVAGGVAAVDGAVALGGVVVLGGAGGLGDVAVTGGLTWVEAGGWAWARPAARLSAAPVRRIRIMRLLLVPAPLTGTGTGATKSRFRQSPRMALAMMLRWISFEPA